MGAAANWRAPTVPEDETLLYDEPGRVLDHGCNRVCYGAYHYRLTQPEFGQLTLRVRHGGGEESQTIGYDNPILKRALGSLGSDERFVLLHLLRTVRHNGAKEAAARVRMEYAQAFTDGRLRKRKERGANRVKVWIEPAAATA